MPLVTPEELLTWSGVRNPTPVDQEWAERACAAVIDAVYAYLDRGGLPSDTGFTVDRDVLDSPPNLEGSTWADDQPELIAAARMAASELYRRRDAPFGSTGYVDPTSGQLFRLARDYLEGVKPVLWRYRDVSGLVA